MGEVSEGSSEAAVERRQRMGPSERERGKQQRGRENAERGEHGLWRDRWRKGVVIWSDLGKIRERRRGGLEEGSRAAPSGGIK